MTKKLSVTSTTKDWSRVLNRDADSTWPLFAIISQALKSSKKDADNIMLTKIHDLLKNQIPDQLEEVIDANTDNSPLGLKERRLSWQLGVACQRQVSLNKWHTNKPISECFYEPVYKAVTRPDLPLRAYYTSIITINNEEGTVFTTLITSLQTDKDLDGLTHIDVTLIEFTEQTIYSLLL